MNRTLAFSQLGLGRNELGQASLERAFTTNPGDTRAGTALAMLYIRQGKTRLALQTAEAMVKREPANLTVLNFLGSVKGATGDKRGARAAYMQALAKDAAFTPSALNLVRLDISEKNFDDARRRLDGLLAKRHDDANVLYEYGVLELRSGRFAEAVRHWKKASEVRRNDLRPLMALIDLYLSQNQADQALNVAKTMASNTTDNVTVQLVLGRTYLAAGDVGNARSVLSKANRLANYDARTLLAIARLQLLAGDSDGANYSVQKALQVLPDDPTAMMMMVEIEARNGNAAKADAALNALTAKHPGRVETSLAKGDLAMSRAQYPIAIAAYRTALGHGQSTGNALALARAHLAAGEAGKAATFLEDWVKTRPNDIAAQKALAESQFRAGQLPAARQSYQRVIEAEPDDAPSLNNYANLLHLMNDSGAQAQAEKALKLSPNNSSYADTLGWILVQKGQVETGLRYLREARLRNPENGEIRYHLSYALAKTGRNAEAKDELSAALVGPGKVPSSEAVTQLKKELGL